MNDQGDNTGSSATVWDQAASSYDKDRQRDPVYSSCINQIARRVPAGTRYCLDAGCGTGLSTLAIKSKCEVVFAVDYSHESLIELRKKKAINVFLVQADVTALPFRESLFDASISANILQHFRPDGPQQKAIQELSRVTKPDGTIGVSVHHFSKGKRRAGWKKEGKPGQVGIDYIYRFVASDLFALIPRGSCKAVGYYGLLKIPFLGSRLQNAVAQMFGFTALKLGFGHMLVADYRNKKPAAPTASRP